MKTSTDIAILKLLLKATQNKIMAWEIVDDDNSDRFSSKLGEDSFEIELIYMQRSCGRASERSLVEIQGSGICETYSIGTDGYNLLIRMLGENIFGWKEGLDKSETRMLKLQKRIQSTITGQLGENNENSTDVAH
ncbi:MAG: hypothetical protein JJU29_08475 [Verrucomicrobia bacterium]|nr:hypothetical protein [Verrucomicrobiota bacterium]